VDAEALVRPVVESDGLELVDVTFGREHGRRVLRLTVDRADGVDLDAISRISEKVSRRLDLEGFEPGPYALEVTTPGLQRRLRRPDDFRRAVGERVRITTEEGAVEGPLREADDEAILVGGTDEERRVPLSRVRSAETVVDWDAELRRSTR
jgi:ribosome maturation factor RimP